MFPYTYVQCGVTLFSHVTNGSICKWSLPAAGENALRCIFNETLHITTLLLHFQQRFCFQQYTRYGKVIPLNPLNLQKHCCVQSFLRIFSFTFLFSIQGKYFLMIYMIMDLSSRLQCLLLSDREALKKVFF